jgi:hypothetical protein
MTPNSAASFPDTRISLVCRALGPTRDPEAQNIFAAAYWEPVYAFVRRSGAKRKGLDRPEAEDFVQWFFALLGVPKAEVTQLEWAENYEPTEKPLILPTACVRSPELPRVSVRAFLKEEVTERLADWHQYYAAQKRGGEGRRVAEKQTDKEGNEVVVTRPGRRAEHVEYDFPGAEDRLCSENPELSPGDAYDRKWATHLLARAKIRLVKELEATKGESYRIAAIAVFEGAPAADYLGVLAENKDAIYQIVKHLRKRYRKLLEAEISDTLSLPTVATIREEMRYISAALGWTTAADTDANLPT